MENKSISQDRSVQPRMPNVSHVIKLDISSVYARARTKANQGPILFKPKKMMMTPTSTKMDIQPNAPRINMLKTVNHIETNRGKFNQGKHLKFPIVSHPKGPYNHHLVVRVDTGADVNCMNDETFQGLFPKV